MQTIQEDLLAMDEKALLAELILELRRNTEELTELLEVGSDMYLLQKEMAWDRQNSW